jgi:hypothetical protein
MTLADLHHEPDSAGVAAAPALQETYDEVEEIEEANAEEEDATDLVHEGGRAPGRADDLDIDEQAES